MKSEEKIKVFISSKCGGERINFDQLVKDNSKDKKNVADTATKTNYDLVRRALKNSLEETGFITAYVFEDSPPSTLSAKDDYIYEIDDCHVCLFLIDNFDKNISGGLLTEITRAQRLEKKSIYIFLNHPSDEKTNIQELLTGPKGLHYYPVYDIRDFIDKGYQCVLDDITKIYRMYCRGKLTNVETETPTIEITKENFPIEILDIDKQSFKNLGKTKNKLVSLVHTQNGRDIQSSDLDKLCLDILEFLLGEKKFIEINLSSLLGTLKGIQSTELHSIVSKRWEAISMFYSGDLNNAIKLLELIYNQFSQDTTISKWLINDVLIDWRNLIYINDQVENVIDFSVQEKINQENSLIFFPLIDRFSTNISNDIAKRNFDISTSSPYSNFFFNMDFLFSYISNYLLTAIYYGSYTHIVFTLHEIQKVLLDLVQKENNLLYKIQLMRVSILWGDEKDFSKIVGKYKSSLSNSTTTEVLDLYKLADTKPLPYLKANWKIILFKEIGYYFSDADYESISKEIFDISFEWISDENLNIHLTRNLIDALKFNRERLPEEKIIHFAMEVLNKKYYRFFDSLFDLLSGLNFSEIPPELLKRLLLQVKDALENEDIKQQDMNLRKLLVRIRKSRGDFSTEIDAIVQENYPEFYKQDYSVEVFPYDRSLHIPRYLDSIRSRNEVQGKNGTFFGFVDNPYITIKNIIELDKIPLPEELLNDLLKEIANTLFSETQSHSEKISSIRLLLCLKRQDLSYSFNWNNYYSNLQQNIAKVEKGHSDFFENDSTLLIQLYLAIVRITFGDDSFQETLETLALINNSSNREIIDSLIALEEYLKVDKHALEGNTIISVLVQYISAFCFHDDYNIRRSTVWALSELIDSQYANFVAIRLAKMMDDDDFGVKLAVIRQAYLIKKHNPETFNYIMAKAKNDNNYLVRKSLEKMSEK